ncbi:MAG: molybdate ABC transporter substrate-binding protein [Candidimonas sp.]|nr:MAG: molybdate ABC transporter substrate-binding protein [Candidimonas sp.]TAM18782.1 MAG: molybdate ABC transporter substrate-binding protein [Candidimonas sp.]TAM74697.1 MAG: molybdate ABC transporter substrate-binding protein [Candidimonas sp.]
MAFTVFGCVSTVSAGQVVVSAAASLTNAFKAVAVAFESGHHGVQILPTFGASDVVLQQIINGAPADVFASADQKAMDKAVAAKVIEPTTRRNFARNEVVLIVPADSKLGLRSADDLKRADVKRITYGNPASVPVGRYTMASLKKAGLWAPLQAKSILAQNVRQALDYVARDEVDAGFVFATDAAIMPTTVKVVQRMASPQPVLYPIALTVHGQHNQDARAFIKFVLSPQGQAILARYGFTQP